MRTPTPAAMLCRAPHHPWLSELRFRVLEDKLGVPVDVGTAVLDRQYQGKCFTTVPAHRTIAAGTLRSIARDLAPCLGEGWLQ